MQTYITIGDFVYSQDKFAPYGWGIAEYTTPEMQLGPDFVTSAYQKSRRDRESAFSPICAVSCRKFRRNGF